MNIMTAQAYVGPYPYTLLYSHPTVCGASVIRYSRLIVENTSDVEIAVFSETESEFNNQKDFEYSGETKIPNGCCRCFNLGEQGVWARLVEEKNGLFARINLTYFNQTTTNCPIGFP